MPCFKILKSIIKVAMYNGSELLKQFAGKCYLLVYIFTRNNFTYKTSYIFVISKQLYRSNYRLYIDY